MPKAFLRRAAKTSFLIINGAVSLLFLIACLSPYLNPAKWWFIGFTGLIVPYLVLVLVLLIVFWLIAKPLFALLPLVTLVVGWQQLYVLFAWHTVSTFSKHKHDEAELRIADWNVQSFNGLTKNASFKKIARTEVAECIVKFKPDVICLQEFNQGSTEDNIGLFSRQYPHHFFSKDYHRSNGYQSGCIIFSKYPIVDTGRIPYPVAESLIFADIVKGDDTLRIYTTHLQSFKFKKEDYDDIEKIKGQDDENLAASKSLFRKMRLAFKRRGIQASLVREELDKSPYPSVICGDFNDVPNSFAYFHIRGNDRQDAFLARGFGVGRSFISLAPTLRIDYILPDKRFEVKQFEMIDEALSDHIMLLSDIRLKK